MGRTLPVRKVAPRMKGLRILLLPLALLVCWVGAELRHQPSPEEQIRNSVALEFDGVRAVCEPHPARAVIEW